jgi:TPR repeat protein
MSDLCVEFYNDRSSGKNTGKCLSLAQKGTELKYSGSMNMLGILYNYGIGVDKDEKKAANIYEEAAELGNPAASANIAYMYMNGIGRTADYRKAFKHAKLAAENGIPRGQFFLGGFYMNELNGKPAYNTIVEKNPQKAFECYLAAANRGYMPAYMPLADCYWFGKGTGYDRQAALEWYEKADCEEGFRRMADIYGNKYNDKYYDPKKAFECLKKAAALGNDPEYDYELGKCYYEGTGTKRDAALAAKHLLNCYKKHKETSKKEECAYMLGVLYKNGQGVEQSDTESFKYFVEAASSYYGHNIKALYEVSKYVRRDPEMFNCMSYDFKTRRHYFSSCGVKHYDGESMFRFCRREGLLEARWEYYAGGYSQSRSDSYRDLMEMADENYLPAMEEVLGLYDDGEIELSDRKLLDLYLKVKKQGGRIYLSKNITARLELLLK